MFRKTPLILILLYGLKMSGQQPMNFRYADSLTYSQYTEGNWNGLIRTGREAIRSGHDYYYMRMRMGIAFFENKNYALAQHHFRKALGFSENDQIAQEYIFYSSLLSGRTFQAWAKTSSFFPQNRDRIVRESRIKRNNLTIESFVSDANTGMIIEDPGSWFANPEPGSQIATSLFLNNSVSMSHMAGRNISYYHVYTNMIKENYLHYYDGTYYTHLYPQRVIQNQYYGAISLFSSSGWIFSPSFHFLTTSYPIVYISNTGMNPRVETYKTTTNGFYAGMALTRSSGYLSAGIEGGYSDFNNIKKMQGTLNAVFYPAGNSRFYIGGKISVIKSPGSIRSETGYVEGAMAGFSIAGKVWFEFSGLIGDLDHYAENNGLYIYNSTDLLGRKTLARIIIPFSKAGLTLFAGAGISSYSSDFIPADGVISVSSNRINYNSNNYTGGISWNF